MGLFGGGSFMFESQFQAFNAVPLITDTVEAGLIPDWLAHERMEGVSARDLTYFAQVIRKDDLLQFSDPLAAQTVSNYEEVVADWQALLRDSKKATKNNEKTKSGEDGKSKSLKQIVFIECVAPSTRFYFRLRTKPLATDAQKGLLLRSLEDYSHEMLGGFSRSGFGLTSMNLDLAINGEHAGTILQTQHCHGSLTESLISDELKAFDEALENLSFADMEQFFAIPTGKAADVKEVSE